MNPTSNQTTMTLAAATLTDSCVLGAKRLGHTYQVSIVRFDQPEAEE